MRKEKIRPTVIWLIAAMFSLQWHSCEKDADVVAYDSIENAKKADVTPVGLNGWQKKENDGKEAYTVLGEQRKNPFSVTSVSEARRSLYGAGSQNVVATHRYIKFMPQSQDHLAMLTEWETATGVALFDFPLDYEIVTMGEAYIDPSVADSMYTYQYASVPVGVEQPDVPKTLLEDLYLDRSDPLLLAESFRLRGYGDRIATDLVGEGGIRLEELGGGVQSFIPIEPDCPPGCVAVLTVDAFTLPVSWVWECDCSGGGGGGPELNACGCPLPTNFRHPAGCINVATDIGPNVPVRKVKVKVKDNWFFSDVAYTDGSGCWHVDKSYGNKVWMWVKFENNDVKVRDGRYWLGAKVVSDYAGSYGAPPYNNITVAYSNGAADNTSNERMYWAAAHTMNTVNDYRVRAAAAGIPVPRQGLNWYNQQGAAPAGAPMLQGNPFNSWPSYLAAIVLTLPYAAASYTVLPDVVNRYAPLETAARFNGTAYHELGHTSHHTIVGESYWRDYRNHVINNGGYGAFNNFAGGSDPGKVALGEALGNFTGAIFGGTPEGGETSEWEDNFIPRGLMFDLGDVSPGDVVTDPNNPAISGLDNISGFTPAMIFNALQPNVDNIRSFRDRLRTLHLGDTPNTAGAYNIFVDIYDVFN